MQVVKRNNEIVDFDPQKIVDAVTKAYLALQKIPDIEATLSIANKIENQDKDQLTIDEIQNLVEIELMDIDTDLAKAYIIYRAQRDKERRLIKTYNEIVEIEDTYNKKENANINGNTPSGQLMKFASAASTDFALSHLISPEYAEAHGKTIYIHDIDYYTTRSQTCTMIDLGDILQGGFYIQHGYVREPQRLSVAVELTCIIIQTSQNEQHGGQAIHCIDYALVPYAIKSFKEHFADAIILRQKELNLDTDPKQIISKLEDKYGELNLSNELIREKYPKTYEIAKYKLIKEAEQSMQALVFNLNSMHSRGGGQVPFSSINTGTNTTPEGRIINKALLKAIEEGLGQGETSIFPIVIWQVKEGVNWSDNDYVIATRHLDDLYNQEYAAPNYDLTLYAMRVSAKRLFPTFLFQDTSYHNIDDKYKINDPDNYKYLLSTMGCRTFVYSDLYGEDKCIGRNNSSFTSVNLPRLALLAKGKEPSNKKKRIKVFYELLDETMNLARHQLKDRQDYQMNAKAKQFPFITSNGTCLGIKLDEEELMEEIVKHGSLGIGFIGLAECLVVLTGKHHGEDPKSQKQGLEIIKHMRENCDMYRDIDKRNYALLATPAEGLSGKFTVQDKKDFGIIKGVTDREYYTNSNHVPVYYNITAYDKIRIEAPYNQYTNGGSIMYIEMDSDVQKNILVYMKIIKCMKDNDVHYGAINVPSCRCYNCGYDGEIEAKCPVCGEEQNISIIKRITGYLVGDIRKWNNSKKAEQEDRVKHTKGV